jgi:L-lactate dehydrogenase
VIGEHGDTEVLVWSRVTVGAIPLDDFCGQQNTPLDDAKRAEIDEDVRRAAYQIIEGKGATYYGVGSAIARLVHAILDNQHAVLTICTPLESIAGVEDVTLAMPHILGAQGNIGWLPLPLNEQEEADLHTSASTIKAALNELL